EEQAFMQAKRPEPVDVFLREARRSLRAGRIVFLDRVLSDLSRLGITKTEAVDMLIDLAPSHLHKGPEADRNMPGEIWVFDYHSDVHGQLYIKLKLVSEAERRVLCISLHEWGLGPR
ncbi:MAG TPA: type II toxin-antitoxin system MqsR family toxin, partial [Candidatus Fermentibacter daniensis]|nr:type II toxin-antitoxin system MqsR family toxin [Candidatus Fermentibacter daniensis]HPN63450.1 type II toxin-antitoxin system MqsR family toxin [Candidatus Fermentibacter daniensis]